MCPRQWRTGSGDFLYRPNYGTWLKVEILEFQVVDQDSEAAIWLYFL